MSRLEGLTDASSWPPTGSRRAIILTAAGTLAQDSASAETSSISVGATPVPHEDNPYASFLVVKEGSEEEPAVVLLAELLQRDEVRHYIEETDEGAVIPAFQDRTDAIG